ncbi:MAG: protein translocase subunit SecF [Myxococcota bacterium]|jgi:preprotein translocase subunit SecF
MMQWIKQGTKIDFVGQMKIWIGLSVALILVSVVSLFVKELNYGIDFAGGTEIHVRLQQPLTTAEIRDVVTASGFNNNLVQTVGSGDRDYLIRVQSFSSMSDTEARELRGRLSGEFGGPESLTKFRFGSETGDKIELKFAKEMKTEQIAAVFSKLGYNEIQVRQEGKVGDNQFLVILSGIVKKIEKALNDKYPAARVEVLSVDAVGPQVGKQLRTDGFLAIVYSIFAILAYVAFRFDVRFAPGAILSLVHDAIIIIGLFNILGLEFDMTILAAILTLLGFSISDTIVVYDRIRENLPKFRNSSLTEVVNLSVNETLSRTIMTSFTVALVSGSLLFFGGHTLFGFALAMFVGTISGTYSSVFVAAPVTIALENWIKSARKA